jgi:hypothetical protein
MVDVSYLGYKSEDPKFGSMNGREALLQAPLLPFDGMNEHGLVVGMAAVDYAELPNDPAKPTVGSLRIIRLVLDQCRTVPEALEMFHRYNIDFDGGPQIHYLIADAAGGSALVEHSGNEVRVLKGKHGWQAATNFHCHGNEHRACTMCDRYALISQQLSKANGQLSIGQSLDLLQQVSQPNTRWSAVYELKQREVRLVERFRITNSPSHVRLPAKHKLEALASETKRTTPSTCRLQAQVRLHVKPSARKDFVPPPVPPRTQAPAWVRTAMRFPRYLRRAMPTATRLDRH